MGISRRAFQNCLCKICLSLNINDNAYMYTLSQKELFHRLKAKQNIERVIWYYSGSLAIETAENKDIITQYINRKGDEEFCFNKRSRVLLLTNQHTTQIGIYSLSKKVISFEIGYTRESVGSLLNRFVNHHKLIKYNDETS